MDDELKALGVRDFAQASMSQQQRVQEICDAKAMKEFEDNGGSADVFETRRLAGAMNNATDALGSCVERELKKKNVTDFAMAKAVDSERALRRVPV